VCANRIPAPDGVYDAVTKRLAETACAMQVADGFEPAWAASTGNRAQTLQ